MISSRLLLLSVLCSSASAQTYFHNFQRTFDPGAAARGEAIVALPTGDYASISQFSGNVVGLSGERPILQRLDPQFSIALAVTFAHPGELASPATGPQPWIEGRDLAALPDKGFAICGRYLDEIGIQGGFLLRVDASGAPLWFRVYPAIRSLESVVHVVTGSNGPGFIACGDTQDALPSGVILRTDINGTPLCSTSIRGSKNGILGASYLRKITPLGSMKFACVGRSNFAIHDTDVLVSVVSDKCEVTFANTYGREFDTAASGGLPYGAVEYGNDITKDGSRLVLTGVHRAQCYNVCLPANHHDILIARLTQAGTVDWANRYDIGKNDDDGNSVVIAVPGDRPQIFVAGKAITKLLSTFGNSSEDAYLLEVSRTTGSTQSCRVFGSPLTDAALDLAVNGNRDLVMFGHTEMPSSAYPLIYLIERYNTFLVGCHDAKAKAVRIPVELPVLPAVVHPVIQTMASLDLVRVAVPFLVETPCPKIPVDVP